jgi:hypothetical protein
MKNDDILDILIIGLIVALGFIFGAILLIGDTL